MNNEWLKELKVGDEVVYDDGGHYSKRYNVITVNKITPTGIIKTSDGKSWSNEGGERGSYRDPWRGTIRLQPYTDEIKEYITRQKAIVYLGHANFEELPTDKLIEITGIIELYKK